MNGYFLTPPYNLMNPKIQGVYAFYPMGNEVMYSRIIPEAWKLDPDVYPGLIYRDPQPGDAPGYFNPSQDIDQSVLEVLADDDALATRVPNSNTVL